MRVIQNVKGTEDKKLEFKPVLHSGVLYSHTVSYVARCVQRRKSTRGFVNLYNGE